MLLIPIRVDAQSYDLFVALQDDNLERIRQHDPCDARLHTLGDYQRLRLREVIVGYASPEDGQALLEMAARGASSGEAVALLSRGYTFDPERGDGGQVIRVPRPQ